ncbi:MAG: exo-alpha-sialidase [Ignavibacteria bacterium]|nr:exo-alpha-sialidase [Ignavibacteria bacterium]
MKKLFFLLPAVLLLYVIMTGQSNQVAEKWDVMPTGLYDADVYISAPLPQVFDFINPNTQTRYYQNGNEVVAVAPNVRVLPRTNSYQSEVNIVRHPLNPLIMFGSSNAFNNTGTLFISEGIYVTTNGGSSWFGSDTMKLAGGTPVPNQGGDPGIAIDKNGVFIQTHLGFSTSGMFGNYSTDNGLTWSNNFTIATGSQDKNLAASDDAPSSPYYGRSYCVWSRFTASAPPIAVSYTTNGGVSWSASADINVSVAGHYSQGCDIRTGPNGEVYVVWAAPVSSGTFTEDFAGFAKSTNGGVSWTVTNNAFDMNGIRGTFPTKSNIRVNGFTRIDVDRSGGARNGWIYIVTSERNLAPAGTDPDVIMHRSTDGGATWSAGIRVNQDPLNNGKYQYFPAVRVDEAGGVNIVYYDDRNTASDSSEIYISRSLDGGNTWSDMLVSDHRFKPKSIGVSGIATGYQGDYIGITSSNGKLWPLWMDDYSGIYNAWTAGVQITTFPLNSFNLTSPAAGARIETLPNNLTNNVFTWDTASSTASYKWIFGSPNASSRQITLLPNSNSLNVTSGDLDALLAGLGLAQGDSLVGQWDVWAFRNNITNDSLKANNGPRSITLKRKKPALTAFNLSSPLNNTSILTLPTNTTPQNFIWTRSGAAVTYKWLYARPNFSSQSNVKFSVTSNSGGFDTLTTVTNSKLDSMLAGIGIAQGDSSIGQWRVYGYSAGDSLASSQTYNLTLRRGLPPTVTTSADSLVAYLPFGSNNVVKNLNVGNIGQFTLNWVMTESTTILDNARTENIFSADILRQIENMPKGAADIYSGPEVLDGMGGPDAGGYSWIDSDEPGGPVYNYVDISGVGTAITTWTTGTGDDGAVTLPLPFSFNYYGNNYSSLKVCTNGWASFDVASTNVAFTNAAIPSAAEPNNALYAFWDDLDVRTSGQVFYYNDAVNNRFIVEYKNVPHYSTGGPYTFQILLYADGRIYYQYQNVTSPNNSNTIGIENSTGTISTQLVFNNIYAKNNFAVKLERGIPWVDESPAAGSLNAMSNQNVNVTFNSTGLAVGTYSGVVKVNSNDPATPVKNVNVKLYVGQAAPAQLTIVNEGYYNLADNLNIRDTVRVYLRNTSPPYAVVDSAKSVIDSLNFTGSFLFANAPNGTYYLQVKSRNCIETWSKAGGETYTTGSTLVYNFTSASSQAYGNNLKLLGSRHTIYSGDVNQDGIIDLSDLQDIDNNAFNFATGYIPSDLTGDYLVDLSDLTIADNNAFNFITRQAPPGAAPKVKDHAVRNNTVKKTVPENSGYYKNILPGF